MKISTILAWTALLVLFGVSRVDAKICCSDADCDSGDSCLNPCCTCSPPSYGQCQAPAPPADAPTTDVDITCFSAQATVPVQGKGPVAMKDLMVGDKVAVPGGKYEPVYAWAVREPEQETEFLQIFTTSLQKPLEITPLHLMYVEGHAHPVQASTVHAGDVLHGEDDSRVTVQKVKSVVRKDGAYAPLTPSGKIMVDGIQVSTYASLQKIRGEEYAELANGALMPISQHTGIHMHLALYRMFCLGISSSFCDASREDGTSNPAWVKWGMKLADLADAQIVPVQVVMGIIDLLMVVPFYAIEVMFGSKFAPFAMAMAGFAFVWVKKNGAKEKKF